jgi:hypothetical protein
MYARCLETGEDTLIWRRKLSIALSGGIVLEEAVDLSSDRLLMIIMIILIEKDYTNSAVDIPNASENSGTGILNNFNCVKNVPTRLHLNRIFMRF